VIICQKTTARFSKLHIYLFIDVTFAVSENFVKNAILSKWRSIMRWCSGGTSPYGFQIWMIG